MTQAIPFELEGMVSTFTVLRLLTDDLTVLQQALREKIEQAPGFFADAPVALDLSVLEGRDDEEGVVSARKEVPLAALAALLRGLNLVPIGIRYLREARRQEARAAGLGVVRGSGRRPTPSKTMAAAEATAEAATVAPDFGSPSLVLRAPLRSGQVVYAEQADAIVLAPVNAGAEVIADGNIHVYGALRGRALAGAHGNTEARIFTKSLEADLVAVAGCYLRSDEIPEARRGKPAQIYLERGELVVGEL